MLVRVRSSRPSTAAATSWSRLFQEFNARMREAGEAQPPLPHPDRRLRPVLHGRHRDRGGELRGLGGVVLRGDGPARMEEWFGRMMPLVDRAAASSTPRRVGACPWRSRPGATPERRQHRSAAFRPSRAGLRRRQWAVLSCACRPAAHGTSATASLNGFSRSAVVRGTMPPWRAVANPAARACWRHQYNNGISLERTAGRSPASQEHCASLGNACVTEPSRGHRNQLPLSSKARQLCHPQPSSALAKETIGRANHRSTSRLAAPEICPHQPPTFAAKAGRSSPGPNMMRGMWYGSMASRSAVTPPSPKAPRMPAAAAAWTALSLRSPNGQARK